MVEFYLAFCLFAMVLSLKPIIPAPNEATSGDLKATFNRCSIQFDESAHELAEIHELFLGLVVKNHAYDFFLGSNYACLTSDANLFIITTEVADTSCTSEAYELTITESKAKISSACPAGIIRGYSTLFNLFDFDEENNVITIDSLPIHIKDEPRFAYRGLLVDTSRHFITKATLLRIIQGMALTKINVLHWHISDDDSFPMYSPTYPGLAKDAAFSPSMVFSKEDVKEITDYAAKMYIKVVPEIDTPAHTRAIGLHSSLRKILTCFEEKKLTGEDIVKGHMGPPDAAMDPSMSETYTFLENMFRDVDGYFKGDMIHLGGDEVSYKCWDERPAIKEFMRKNNIADYHELMNYYINREYDIIKKINPSKKMIQWVSQKEVKNGIKYKADHILQYWDNSEHFNTVSQHYRLNKFILSPNDFAYLDCGYESPSGKNCWCGEFKTWTHMYRFEPMVYGIPAERILGGEVCAWSEVMNNDNIENKIWPRSAAFAAAFWENPRPMIPDLPKLATALNNLSTKLKSLGISTSPITGEYCERASVECFSKY